MRVFRDGERTLSTLGHTRAFGDLKILRHNTACTNRITVDGEALEHVETFTYLGSVIDENGGSDTDVKARISQCAVTEYLGSVGQTLSATICCVREQTRSQREELLKVDGTHIEESTQLRHKTSPHMEPSRLKEKGKTKENITPRNRDRHEKNEQQLDRTRKEGPGQSGLEDAGRRSMLHWQRQA
ncbi:unnamed protein product [Schistosoma mattheei]|uniref:Uncharacterized protein n=1 Tax=Schistosoma mattheei TaxID=31246 RepID=A0A183Q6Q6_9TREM|nr:unnamed protein product [Schistosoma mattheei]